MVKKHTKGARITSSSSLLAIKLIEHSVSEVAKSKNEEEIVWNFRFISACSVEGCSKVREAKDEWNGADYETNQCKLYK